MSLDAITFDEFDDAIIRVLRKHPEGIRNAKLNRNSIVSGNRHPINVKTFNKHLARLVQEGIVERNEISRGNVTYKLHPTESESFRRDLLKQAPELAVEALKPLFDLRGDIGAFAETRIEEIQRTFNKILYLISSPMELMLVSALIYDNSLSDLSLDVHQALEYYRGVALELYEFVNRDDETRAFFLPLLQKVGEKMSGGIFLERQQIEIKKKGES